MEKGCNGVSRIKFRDVSDHLSPKNMDGNELGKSSFVQTYIFLLQSVYSNLMNFKIKEYLWLLWN